MLARGRRLAVGDPDTHRRRGRCAGGATMTTIVVVAVVALVSVVAGVGVANTVFGARARRARQCQGW